MNLTGEAVYLLTVHRARDEFPVHQVFADAAEAIKAARSAEPGQCADRTPGDREYIEGVIYRGDFYGQAGTEVRRLTIQ